MRLKKIRLKKIINEGDVLPRGYGVAYWQLHDRTAVCYPMPANSLVSLFRAVFLWIRFPPWRNFATIVELERLMARLRGLGDRVESMSEAFSDDAQLIHKFVKQGTGILDYIRIRRIARELYHEVGNWTTLQGTGQEQAADFAERLIDRLQADE